MICPTCGHECIDLSITFGKRLREVRRRMGLSREEVADLLGYDVMTIRRWETGKHKPRMRNFNLVIGWIENGR